MKVYAPITPAASDGRATYSRRRRSGMTLVEVMIAATVFTVLSAGLTATYVSTLRYAKLQSYRTQAITTAMSVLEQMRECGYADLNDSYYTASTPANLTVRVLDVTATSSTPTLYRELALPINARDGTVLNTDWTETEIDVEPTTTAPKLPMKFWVVLNGDIETGTTTTHQIFQLALVYQWRVPGNSTTWQTGNMRMVVPRESASTK